MSTHKTLAEAFADAAAGMVSEHHVADVLAQLVIDCGDLVSAQAVAVLVAEPGGDLSLLSATTHEATLLEMLQVQTGTGPCVDCIEGFEHVSASSGESMIDRWGDVGRAIVLAGFQAVDAYPM